MNLKLSSFHKAYELLKPVVKRTPLELLSNFSEEMGCQIYAKREDLQVVRSYKVRGAYHMIASLPDEDRAKGVVCASAGNHAQGVAFACKELNVPCRIYMPETTPKQKIRQVQYHGNGQAVIIFAGDTFDQSYEAAKKESMETGKTLIPPFDHPQIVLGQGSVALEILEDLSEPLDYLFIPVGGGGLAAGIGPVFWSNSSTTRLIGVEPAGAPAMKKSIEQGQIVELDEIDTFTDGAAVKKVGDLTFPVCRDYLEKVVVVPEGLISKTILLLYNQNAIVAEPAGALALAAVELMKDELKGKRVGVIISGGNNDISRFPDFKERSLLYKNLKHYFIVRFPQRPGALKEFVAEVLGQDDDIVHFEYSKKTARENGPALVGVELKKSEDFEPLVRRMKDLGFFSKYVNDKQELMEFLL
ncbi:MAG: threonine ammonia-lyase IlvA [Bacteroidetes bacterium]|jgi:threonine dehydratase|nr:threonine ammonia-lyase IlvA [Bacteroidota bacterium]MBT4397942.1 threonine ammonia-lyase IlvA [Bacteroidota bacterium]MBT4409138.1 threonine ammonia-lyase IlvA [Bacteroidota bacterium]MBT7093255.1 threonine ammonia-lyase IlvA [Bacteroidota bacterium]MBT7462950.1 threonine ammonia-lyase IlvA [Bacteroidota bacterium]